MVKNAKLVRLPQTNKAEFGNLFNIRPANLFSKWRLKKFRWETNFQIVVCVETNRNIRKEKYTKKVVSNNYNCSSSIPTSSIFITT